MISVFEIQEEYPLVYSAICDLGYDNQLEIDLDFHFPDYERDNLNKSEKFFEVLTVSEIETFIFGSDLERELLFLKYKDIGAESTFALFDEIFEGDYDKLFLALLPVSRQTGMGEWTKEIGEKIVEYYKHPNTRVWD